MFDLYRNTPIGDTTTYVRPYQTISTGPLNGNNTLTIFEEQITVLPDGSTVRSDLGTPELQKTITDPNEVFNILNPTTDAVIGTMTFAQLRIYMNSLYRHIAAQRDQALIDAQNALLPPQ